MRLFRSRKAERATGPPPRSKRVSWLGSSPYAHRGLHGGGRVENSRAAFQAAIARGHGIELDVQLSRDGHAIVFHDEDLDRLAEGSGRVERRSLAELSLVRLRDSGETIPSLPEILGLTGGRVPLLIEIKANRHKVPALCLAVFHALDGYRGQAAVMSFNPDVGRWFARHGPRVTRGLVVTESGKKRFRGWVERRLSLWRSRPDFLAYDIRDLPSRFAARQRRRGLPVLTWTVRHQADRERSMLHADQIIYEDPA